MADLTRHVGSQEDVVALLADLDTRLQLLQRELENLALPGAPLAAPPVPPAPRRP